MDATVKKAKRKYILLIIIGYLVMLIPVVVYNAVNWKAFENVTVMKFTFSFLIGISMALLAILMKTKKDKRINTSGAWLLAIGAILTIMSEIALQVGVSMLLIGGGLILDMLLFHPLAMKYREIALKGQGEQVVHVSKRDWF